MTSPVVDVVIPVHTPERPIARAVGSVLTSTAAPVRVTVVSHNVDIGAIRTALGSWTADERVRMLELRDGVPSPAGPINLGLDAADARFTALLDSDDTYEPGAVDAWLAVQRAGDADAVIPMFRYSDGSSTRTPPTRPFRTHGLDGVRDRLAYRTRLHGLMSRERFGHVRMAEGLRSGEDVIQGAKVWFSDARISFARRRPGYVIHVDGGERTSAVPKPASESLQFLTDLLADPWFTTLSPAQRESFAIKVLRTHVVDILAAALETGAAEDLSAVAAAVSKIEALAPRAREVLSRTDGRILSLLSASPLDGGAIAAAVHRRTDFSRLANVLPSHASALLRREAPLRFLGAVALSP